MATPLTERELGLDRSSPVPLYFQLAGKLEAAIDSGALRAGERLENEIALAERLHLSRPTVRRAIQELVDHGLLVRRRGVGTQVVQGRVIRKVELTSLYDDLYKNNQAPTTRVLLFEAVTAPSSVRAELSLPAGSKVLHLKRLRFATGVPFALLENYLPSRIQGISPEALADHGLYQLLRGRGVLMRVAKQKIGARRSTVEEAELFQVEPGSPVLTMTRTLYDNSGAAIEFGTHSYLPERYSFETTLVERQG
ncbi:MAG: GntR family transcriptional regulator [Cryobacterium sp.]|nr:GntR family transcriptional regulator [Cryobacterium sp.]